MNVKGICRKYLNNKIVSITSIGGGHINDSFLVETDAGRFICQRLAKDMDIEKLEYNYSLYSSLFDKCHYSYPKLLSSFDEDLFVLDSDGARWRIYPLIEGDILSPPLSDEVLFECGAGLARLHVILGNLDGKPQELYPHLHDLEYYFEQYIKLIYTKKTYNTRVERTFSEYHDIDLENIIEKRIEELKNFESEQMKSEIYKSENHRTVIHGDTKLANIIFRDGKIFAFIDYDTIMTGSILDDLADCIRSCCIVNGVFDRDTAEMIVKGYICA